MTGILDDPTKHEMNRPRCGIPDTRSLALGHRKWSRSSLTWSLRSYPRQIRQGRARAIIQEAFDTWSSHIPLQFRETCSTCSADFNIEIVSYRHNGCDDGGAFDGRDGVLAHAYFPEDGKIHFDADEHWIESFDDSGYNFYLVAVHEIGHALGLDHNYDQKSIMFPSYNLFPRRSMLPDYDRLSIQAIYGVSRVGGSTLNIVSGASYKLVNINSNKVLDVHNADVSDGANVKIFTDHNVKNQCWIIYTNEDGTVKLIDSNSGKALDVDRSGTSDGTNVQIWGDNGTNAQKWRPVKVGDVYYKLINVASNKALDVTSSGETDGTNVQSWLDNDTPAQHWRLVRCNTYGTLNIVSGSKYKLVNINSNKVLDVHNADVSDGANVKIFTDHNVKNQCWIIYTNEDGTVKLIDSNSGKALDVDRSGTSDGTNVQIWGDNGTNAQKWRPVKVENAYYKLINVASNKALDVTSSGETDGTNVQSWWDNDTPAQHWRLVECDTVAGN